CATFPLPELCLYFGMVPEGREKDVFAQIEYKTEVECNSHVSTGVVGIQFLMRTLTEYGRVDLAYRIASADTYPSWGYMAANGATTIWELWNGNTAAPFMNSGNHVMLLGDLIIWEYEYLAGIRALEPGYKSIEFKPYPVVGLSFVECSYDSVQGRIVSNWKIEDGRFVYDIEVPRGCRATVLLPEPDGGRKVKKVRFGKHHFEVPYWTQPRLEAKEVDKVLSFISSSWDKTVRSNTEDCPPRLGLPEPYTVPSISGAFQELYYWDTFFTNEGLMLDGRVDLARSNVENMLYLVEKYGKMLNGSAVWFLNRSQPPFLSLMVRSIYEKTGDREWLKKVLPSLEKEYAFWMDRRMTPCGLNRYGNEAPDSDKLEFIKLLKSRFGESFRTEGLSEADLLEIGSHYISEAESGWDFTPRFDGRCGDFCPVDLNALLYAYEENFARFKRELGENGDSWDKAASNRSKLMRKLMRDPSSGMYYDYDFTADRRSGVPSSAVFALLFCGVVSKDDARKIVDATLAGASETTLLEYPYGVSSCARCDCKYAFQWAFPNGWAPNNYLAVFGLDRYGFTGEASRLAGKYVNMVTESFVKTGNLWEKYNVVEGNINVSNEYEMPTMMGWTAGTYRSLCAYLGLGPQ
ncbi:MAG: trehalase family glycosidase, partial [Candidatus Cryptobacteroides sp.]